MSRSSWNPNTRLGLFVAAVVLVLDQASKLWLLFGFRLGEKGVVNILPGVDFVLTWNRGISYGLFQQDTAIGRWLLVILTTAAVAVLTVWLTRAATRIGAVALGLVIGGAIGNGIDRAAYGAVVDFVFLYVRAPQFDFNWYVFNLADAAIVAGVAGLLYEVFWGERAVKAP
jgi:signal peptidase II